MKKLINDPGSAVAEMVEGFAAALPGMVRLPGLSVLVGADAVRERGRRVAVISGGGSGHEPAHAGYVGRGMLAAAVAGEVFTSPSPDAILAAIRAVAGPPGGVLVVKSYTGDRLNFGLAAEMARAEGLPVEMVVVVDDVAMAEAGDHAGRRGLAGTVLVHKVAGAAAAAGLSLAEVAAEARAAAVAVRTMGVALSPCTVPASGRPGFALGPDEVELGLGIHGEPGVSRIAVEPADRLVDRLLGPILADLAPAAGQRVALLVNGLGGTPLMELAIVARRALGALRSGGLVVERSYVGEFLTALEMAGVSLSVMSLDDARLARLDAATDAPAWPNAANRPPGGGGTVVAPAEATAGVPAAGPARTPRGRAVEEGLLRVAAALEAEADRLSALDAAVGDGDLGISLARGAAALRLDLPSWPRDDPAATLHALGLVLRRCLGGTSGPLYAAALLRAATRLGAGPAEDPRSCAGAFHAGCDAVAELGGATPGDRTMLDALRPAAAAFDEALARGEPMAAAWRAAAEAAEAGTLATAGMSPKRGRSSYLGGRAAGHVDPGAAAVAVWLRALAGP